MNIVNLNNLRNAVQSSHVNFLFGSGCSRPYLGTLGNIEKWLTELGIFQKIVIYCIIKS